MKIKEIASSSKQLEELQSASKPLLPEQARVRAMKQGIDRQKLALAESVSASKTLNMLKTADVA